jgi:hypothetical protein
LRSRKSLGTNSFYGQKGGDLPGTNTVFQMSGNWGFVMLWAALPSAANEWYPDYPGVMNVAMTQLNGAADLFPQFGMASL